MKKLKEIKGGSKLAKLIGTTERSISNWKNHNEKPYRVRYEIMRIGALLFINGFSYYETYFLAKHRFKPEISDLLDENKRLNEENEKLVRTMKDIVNHIRSAKNESELGNDKASNQDVQTQA